MKKETTEERENREEIDNEHIASLVAQGYTEGQLLDGDTGAQTGWWKLQKDYF